MKIDENEFDAAAAVVAKSADPMDAAAAGVIDSQRTHLRSTLYNSLLANPDMAARATRIGRQAGIPADVVSRNLPEVERNVQLDEFDQVLQNSPTVAQWLTEQNNAAIAHDDVKSLSALDTALKFTKDTGSAAKGGLLSASAGVVGVVRAPIDAAATLLDPLAGTVLPENPLRRVGAGLEKYQSNIQAQADAAMPKADGNIGAGFFSGIASLTRNAASIPMLFMGPAGQRAALTSMTAPVFGQEYGEAREKGLGLIPAVTYGTSQAGIELFTEKFAISRFLGDIKAGTGFGKMLARQIAVEVPGEQAATALQDLNEWAVLRPDASFGDYLRERPDAAVQTLVATIVGVGGQVATVKGVQTVLERFDTDTARAQEAKQDAQTINQLSEIATSSKLMQRDAGTFQDFVAKASTESPLQEVFVDANTFAQAAESAGVTFDQLPPSVQDQIEDAMMTGGDLRIPVAEYLTQVAPAQYADAVLPHLRTAPEAMSLMDAQAFDEMGEQQMEIDIDTLMAEHETRQFDLQDRTPAEALETVRTSIAQQLNEAGRFTPEVNSAYTEMMTRFFEATAERTGMDVGQLFAEMGPTIVSRMGTARQRFGQDAQMDEQGADVGGLDGQAFNQDTGQDGEQDAEQDDAQNDPPRRDPLGTYSPDTKTISLLGRANLSTFIHEAGHYFLETQLNLATREDASPEIVADVQTTLDWFGVKDLEAWRALSFEETVPYHEKFARGFEAFAFEGNAPSTELAGVFQRFRSWLLRVYESLVNLDVELNDEVRSVFTRMLATKEQIEAMQEVKSYRPLFESAEAAGMTQQEWMEYQAIGKQATEDAVDALQRRSLRDMQWLGNSRNRTIKKLQREAAEKRADVRQEVVEEVNSVPIYALWRDLARPKDAEGYSARLSLPDLKENFPDMVDRIPKGMATNDGTPVEMVAEAYEIESADLMLKLLAELDHPDKVIESRTDEVMLHRFGDLTDRKALERAADEQLHNEARAKFLEREVNALSRAVGNRPMVAKAAREYANETIAKRTVREIRPSQFSAAEARAAKAAAQAFKKGDLTTAAARKREQMLQNELARASQRALGEVAQAIDYLTKFDTVATRQAIGPDYADQIDQLLERFDLRKSTDARTAQRRQSLAKWVEAQRDAGLEPNIDEALLSDSRLVSYRDMTVEGLRGLRDTVKNIEHMGRLKQTLLTVQDQRRFEEITESAAASIVANGGKAKPVELEGREGVTPWLQGVWASHRKISSLMRQMDGGKDAGPMWRIFVRGMNDAGNREQVLIEDATKKLAAMYEPMLKLKGGLKGAKVYIPEINASLSRGGRLSVALNMGNPVNRQRMMDGDGWSSAQIGAILRTLNRQELEFVNQAWEFIDSYWPQISAKQLRVDGVVEQKVEAEPFTLVLPNGESVAMRGGYYPIKYDADRSSRSEALDAAETAKDMMRGAFSRATTRRGHTKARAEIVKRPVRKDLDVMTQHVSQVVHDLAWHEWLIDAGRLLGSKPIDNAIRTYYGPEVLRTLKDDLKGIAAGDLVAQTSIDKMLRGLRANVSRSTMGLSFTTAMLQPFGLTQSMARIGVAPVLRGVARWGGDAARMESSLDWIGQKSDFMRLRSKTFNRELGEIRGKVNGQSKAAEMRDGVLFFLTTKMQLIADVPTWIGQYEKAKSQGLNESTAVALADQAVIDSQGGGTAKDLAQVQRDWPFLTQFYSYFSVTLNLAAEKTATTDFKNPRAVAGWLGDMALLTIIPALAPALVLSALRGEDEDEELIDKLLRAQAGYLLGMVVLAREFSGAVAGFSYSGPPVARAVTDTQKAVAQAADGEIDEPAVLSMIRLMGTLFGIPTVQAIRSYKGWQAWDEGEAPPTAILFGPPQKD